MSLPPGFRALLDVAAVPFGLDAAGPGCIVPSWTFDSRWIATVAAVATFTLLGLIHACGQAHTPHPSAAAPRTPSSVARAVAAFVARSWLLGAVTQLCGPILLRVCVEAMLSSTRASDGKTVLWGEPTTPLLEPPHQAVFAASAVLACLILLVAVLPSRDRSWWNFASQALNLGCAFSVAVRVASERAAVGFLLGLDLVRLGCVWLTREELRAEFAGGVSDLGLFYVSAIVLVALQAIALGCAESQACAASGAWTGVLLAGCVLYAVLLVRGGGSTLWATTRAALHMAPPPAGDAPSAAEGFAPTMPNPIARPGSEIAYVPAASAALSRWVEHVDLRTNEVYYFCEARQLRLAKLPPGHTVERQVHH